jgi:hypothetical protein
MCQLFFDIQSHTVVIITPAGRMAHYKGVTLPLFPLLLFCPILYCHAGGTSQALQQALLLQAASLVLLCACLLTPSSAVAASSQTWSNNSWQGVTSQQQVVPQQQQQQQTRGLWLTRFGTEVGLNSNDTISNSSSSAGAGLESWVWVQTDATTSSSGVSSGVSSSSSSGVSSAQVAPELKLTNVAINSSSSSRDSIWSQQQWAGLQQPSDASTSPSSSSSPSAAAGAAGGGGGLAGGSAQAGAAAAPPVLEEVASEMEDNMLQVSNTVKVESLNPTHTPHHAWLTPNLTAPHQMLPASLPSSL